jgi:hypothetical protein
MTLEDTFLRTIPNSEIITGLEQTLKHLHYITERGYEKEYPYLVRCAKFGAETRLNELERRREKTHYKRLRRDYDQWTMRYKL